MPRDLIASQGRTVRMTSLYHPGGEGRVVRRMRERGKTRPSAVPLKQHEVRSFPIIWAGTSKTRWGALLSPPTLPSPAPRSMHGPRHVVRCSFPSLPMASWRLFQTVNAGLQTKAHRSLSVFWGVFPHIGRTSGYHTDSLVKQSNICQNSLN